MQVFLGFDPREAAAFAVARASIWRHARGVDAHGLVLSELQALGLYTRPTSRRLGRLWDDISGAYMSTEFANSRFLVPFLCGYRGWAVFMDCDVLVRAPLAELFACADDSKALLCVQHDYCPPEGVKMDGQAQQHYARKNWSSVMLINCGHPANAALTPELVNTVPGRDLHRFMWLEDRLIGAIDPAWNWIVGHSDPAVEPKIVHFSSGGPWFAGFEQVAYADEWRDELRRWALPAIPPMVESAAA
jgi:hypothetical protein